MTLKKYFSTLLTAALIALTPQMALADELAPPASASTAVASAPPLAAPAPALAVSKETVDNPYGLDALWKQGDFVARGTLIILIIMSMGSWYVTIVKLFEQYKLMQQAKQARSTFWNANSVEDGINGLAAGSPFRFIAESGVEATQHHKGKLMSTIDLHSIDLNTWVTMGIQRAMENVQSRLQDGLAVLATVGSTAPFVGLFGTVWGIYHALTAIGIAGQASIDKVAGPVGESLIMTAIGLAVAVPAVLAYNWLVRRNKLAMEQVRGFSADLHSILISRVATSAQRGA